MSASARCPVTHACGATRGSRRARPPVTRCAAAHGGSGDGSAVTDTRLRPITEYTRLIQSDTAESLLQTSIVSLQAPAPAWRFWDRRPTRVDLVSAVHVGDGDYYAQLQRRLDADYDRVLYEMVADKSAAVAGQRWRPPPPGSKRRSRSIVGAVQRLASSVLRLTFQLEELDYSKDNWEHADLDLETFQALQKAKGESLLSLAVRLWAASLRNLWKASPVRVLQSLLPIPLVAHLVLHGALSASEEKPLSQSPVVQALLNFDVSSGLKLLLAQQMCGDDASTGLVTRSVDAQHSVILGDRNAAALATLDAALASGARRVAIFYGAAHCPDLEHRLASGPLAMQRVGQEWLPAWRIAMPGKPLPLLERPQLTKTQAAALVGLSAMLASDLYVWELVLRWAGAHVHFAT